MVSLILFSKCIFLLNYRLFEVQENFSNVSKVNEQSWLNKLTKNNQDYDFHHHQRK